MEQVARKVCLDSDIIIEVIRNNSETVKTISSLEANFCLTSVNVFELWGGCKKSEEMEDFLSWFSIFDFDKDSAILAGKIRKELRKKGMEIDFRDIFIASICISNNLELLTNNIKHFERMKSFGLRLLSL